MVEVGISPTICQQKLFEGELLRLKFIQIDIYIVIYIYIIHMCDLFVTIPSDYTIPIVKISVSFECLIYSDVSHHLTTDTTKGA